MKTRVQNIKKIFNVGGVLSKNENSQLAQIKYALLFVVYK